ncbi:MAG: type III-B CRISPR-associated protein Cas10/Cmr2 [Bacteroidia bacterium]
MPHLFLLTIGPVQSFISQARKTRDLYAGSQILSQLTRAGIIAFEQVFPKKNEANIIFPTFKRDDKYVSLPNRFIGKISDKDLAENELQKKGKEIESAIKEKLKNIAGKALREASIDDAPVGFWEQIEAHLEVFWVFEKIDGKSYSEAYQKLEKTGGSIKNIRQFEQFSYAGILGEKGRKCSVDGVNNSLFFKARQNDLSDPTFQSEESIELKRFDFNPGEGLSAISFLKRMFFSEDAFPSTAEVGLMEDMKKLNPEEKEIFDCYKDLFTNNDKKIAQRCLDLFNKNLLNKVKLKAENKFNDTFDYQYLFEENLTKNNFPDVTQLDIARQVQAKFKNLLKTRYYAIVMFDGDRMGQWLSGKYNQNLQELDRFHKELSGLLSAFGRETRKFLCRDNGNGQTVYAGGDDFLGFINISQLFSVMRHLRIHFHNEVNTAVEKFKQPGEDLTFSAGIVIAHYKTPFSEVLKKVREVEKKAKKEGGRNAFAISVLKHSGEIQESVFKWDSDGGSADGTANWDALDIIAQELDKENGHFSNNFIQNLTSEFYQLTGAELHDLDDFSRKTRGLRGALKFEIKRLIKRSFDSAKAVKSNGKERVISDDKRIQNLTEKVLVLWENAPEPKTRNFIHALHIIDFITRKTTEI